ncbi:hypothetical protein Q8F55_005247 [Vanrija albida]|uniref:Exonuclease domain-containing protein n=1 Tax=Vanrija albida TaxID=181172 RepID=A0ABR3Q133_9TREE
MASSSDLKRKYAGGNGVKADPVAASDDGFTTVQRRKQKKLDKHRPEFHYDMAYFRTGKKIGIAHIRDLSVFLNANDGRRPDWIVVDNPSSVKHTVVVLAAGLLPQHLGLSQLPPAASLPFVTTPPKGDAPGRVQSIKKLFSYGCPTRAPGDSRKMHSVISGLLRGPLTEKEKKRREKETKTMQDSHKNGEDYSPVLFLLTPNQMSSNGYRLPGYVKGGSELFIPGTVPKDVAKVVASRKGKEPGFDDPDSNGVVMPAGPRPVEVDENGRRRRGNIRSEEGWVETPEAKGPPPGGKYPVLAIDCEMVLTEDGQELARVSVVDCETQKSVFDELVTPPKPVTDYLTRFSGMTAEGLATAKYTLESVQEALVTGPQPVITPHTILLGHSLDCDLDSLKIRHPLVIDTSVIYRHHRGPPFKPSLKYLTQKYLGKQIQQGEGGHDSEEDARACAGLLKMKLTHGPDFGDPNEDSESVFERLARSNRPTLIADHGNPRQWYGSAATTAVGCTTDDEVVDAVVQHIDSHSYVFARLNELSTVQRWNSSGDQEVDLTDMTDSIELDEALDNFDGRLARLHAALPANSALIVLTGNADPRQMVSLNQRRLRFERAYRALGSTEDIPPESRWMADDDREFERAVAEAREGMAFFCVKA